MKQANRNQKMTELWPLSSNGKKTEFGLKRLLSTVALAGGGATAMATVGAANYLVTRVTEIPPQNFTPDYSFSPFELAVDFEEIRFPTANQRLLSGWLFPRPQTNRVVIAISGHGGRREEMLGIGSYLWRSGFNVMLFDYRGCGRNLEKGDIKTLGHRELEDFQGAVAYIKKRWQEKGQTPIIGVLGGSLGAAVCLVAASRDPEIRAVWADSSFISRREIITYNWQKATHLPAKPFIEVADRIFQQRTGQRMADFSPLEAVENMSPRPMYFVHGGSDETTPVWHSQRLYEAASGSKELWIEPDLYHCGVYFGHRAEYSRRATRFFEENLQ